MENHGGWGSSRWCSGRRSWRCRRCLVSRIPFPYEDDSMRLLHANACILSHGYYFILMSMVQRCHRVVPIFDYAVPVLIEIDAL